MFTNKRLPIGIDLGNRTIKIAQLVSFAGCLKISKLAMVELPADSKDDSCMRREGLKKILKENNIKGGGAYSALAYHDVSIKNIVLPEMPLTEVSAAVEWEVKQKAEGRFDEITFDYVILDEKATQGHNKIRVLIVTSQKQGVLDHVADLKAVGLKALAVEPNAFSLLAELDYNHYLKQKEVVIVLDLGKSISNLNVIRNKTVCFTRLLNSNEDAFIKAVRDYCQVSYQEAKDIFKKFVLAREPISNSSNVEEQSKDFSTRIKNVISFQMEKLVMDIEHTFKYYSFQVTGSTVTAFQKIILCGEMADFFFLVPFLKQRFNVPVEIGNPLEGFEIKKGARIKEEYLKSDALCFGAAIGAALRGVE